MTKTFEGFFMLGTGAMERYEIEAQDEDTALAIATRMLHESGRNDAKVHSLYHTIPVENDQHPNLESDEDYPVFEAIVGQDRYLSVWGECLWIEDEDRKQGHTLTRWHVSVHQLRKHVWFTDFTSGGETKVHLNGARGLDTTDMLVNRYFYDKAALSLFVGSLMTEVA